jgi:hypothetical protein
MGIITEDFFMGTLAVAFALAWGAVALYVMWLGYHQQLLRQRLDALATADQEQLASRPQARAA